MFSKSLALASLLTTTTSSSLQDIKLTSTSSHSELKAFAKQKLSISGTFTEKIEKLTKSKFKSTNVEVDLSKFDHSESNLRGLKIKDNFISYTTYYDDQCTMKNFDLGELVNYCTDEQAESTGVQRSSLVKVNKKENLIVELTYDGFGCKGVPSKVTSLTTSVPNFPGLDTCFSHDFDGQLLYIKVSYLSTYPTLGSSPGYYVGTTYPQDLCTSENKNYETYIEAPLSMVLSVPLDMCIPAGGIYAIFSTSNCAATGHLTANYYYDNMCSMYYTTFDIFDTDCLTDDDDGDDDDDDDGDDDDDDYVRTGVVNNAYCT